MESGRVRCIVSFNLVRKRCDYHVLYVFLYDIEDCTMKYNGVLSTNVMFTNLHVASGAIILLFLY